MSGWDFQRCLKKLNGWLLLTFFAATILIRPFNLAFILMKVSEGKGQLIGRVRDLLVLELHTSAKILIDALANVSLSRVIIATYTL